MKILGRDEILNVVDLKLKLVDVSAWWDGHVYVRSLTANERDEVEGLFRQVAEGTRPYKGTRSYVCSLAICDEQRFPLFTVIDLESLGEKNSAPMDLLFETILDLSGIGIEAVEDAKKNSEQTASQNSSTC